MSNKEPNIDDILKEYSKQKESHESDFGKIAEQKKPLKEIKKSEEPIKEEKKEPKKKKEKKPRKPIDKKKVKNFFKKALLIILAVAAVIGIAFGVKAIVHYAKNAYLKPYKAKYQDVQFPEGIEERFCDMYGTDTNMVGYLDIADLGFQSYITSKSQTELPVQDSTNSKDTLDFNTVIYANSKNLNLESIYKTPEGYLNSSQEITYSTLFDDYNFHIIGAFYTNENKADDLDYCFPYNFTKEMTDKSLDAYTDRLYHRFLYDTGRKIKTEDKLITISVDSNFMNDFRFVVVGVLDGEKSNEADKNEKIHYPQVWYDKNNTENTYRFSSKWYPEIKITNEDGTEGTSKQSEKDFMNKY